MSALPQYPEVLLNLLYNAVKFTVSGSVTLCAAEDLLAQEDDHILLTISVRDTGIGIEEQAQKKLFGMFSKINDSRVRNPLGVGLGLAICKQLVELMGGQIWVTSEYGLGSTFSFTLRLKKSVSKEELLQLQQVLARLTYHPK